MIFLAKNPMLSMAISAPVTASAPGPACYGKGGEEPPVTDANVVLGRLPPSLFGGEMALDPDASSAAVGKIARALGLDVHQAAQGILDFVPGKCPVSCGKMPIQEGVRCISMLHDTKPTICSSSRVSGRAYQLPMQ